MQRVKQCEEVSEMKAVSDDPGDGSFQLRCLLEEGHQGPHLFVNEQAEREALLRLREETKRGDE